MGQQTWAGAIRELWRSATRHKIASAVIALCVAGSLAAIGAASSGSSASSGRAADTVAPTFSFSVLGHADQRVSLADYSGKPGIVNFFASWCVPCKQEPPLLARFYHTEQAKVALVGLDENDVVGNATSFTHSDGVSYPVGWDPQLSAADSYGVAALPQTFFLNSKHRIVDRIFGAVTLATLHKGIALAEGS